MKFGKGEISNNVPKPFKLHKITQLSIRWQTRKVVISIHVNENQSHQILRRLTSFQPIVDNYFNEGVPSGNLFNI